MASELTLEEKLRSGKRSTFGILADKETDEVPGTVRLLSNSTNNEPLGKEKMEHHRAEVGSVMSKKTWDEDADEEAKRTADGKFVLNPQPEDTPNDPLNWPPWRRDCALLTVGFYCMLGGGMTPILAAGFNNVAATFNVSFSKVALTTGLYMMGLGVGSVIFSPTAILFGKRPVYVASSILFVVSAVWCALAPDYANLVVARVFQGIAVSPVECLPSATIAEIFFLHERAFRVGIYTLLLLGGKNLIPLVSAAIIEAKGWRWVFWVVAIVVGFGGLLLFFFVPETFWDRTPRPRKSTRPNGSRLSLPRMLSRTFVPSLTRTNTNRTRSRSRAGGKDEDDSFPITPGVMSSEFEGEDQIHVLSLQDSRIKTPKHANVHFEPTHDHLHTPKADGSPAADGEVATSPLNLANSEKTSIAGSSRAHIDGLPPPMSKLDTSNTTNLTAARDVTHTPSSAIEVQHGYPLQSPGVTPHAYTAGLRNSPPKSYTQTLKLWNGRLSHANWFRVAARPFILYAYPAVLWSSMVYALSVGWLIVLSESVAHIYETRDSYNFSSIQVGLVYISPFVGGVLGTAVAGRVSDIIVRFITRRNEGIYEPEFRLVMAIPIALCTAIGLMGFGWSAEERDNFMVPTIFFGIISFGCCIGSTTAITFCVDSYRQFAAEALVTLNFSKNVLHGLVWSLFFPQWLQSSGSKTVFLAIGGIQVACMLFTIPMYIYGKRARMWTVRMKMLERF